MGLLPQFLWFRNKAAVNQGVILFQVLNELYGCRQNPHNLQHYNKQGNLFSICSALETSFRISMIKLMNQVIQI